MPEILLRMGMNFAPVLGNSLFDRGLIWQHGTVVRFKLKGQKKTNAPGTSKLITRLECKTKNITTNGKEEAND